MKYFIFVCFLFLISCDRPLVDALIIGSAETPDPVLERVIELEKKGVISDVTVLESFPVQIHMKATQKIINELEAVPRAESSAFH